MHYSHEQSMIQQKAYEPGCLHGVRKQFAGWRRVVDVLGAGFGLVILSPVLALCVLWIKAMDRGPAIFVQWRVGKDGWLFAIYKLRTMYLNAEDPGKACFASAGDKRVLPGCGWMRKSHVDELPQLWNILKGEMSLVGPRPERPEVMEDLRSVLPEFGWRLAVEPGLTGLAQLTLGYANDAGGARRKLARDLKYLRDRSWWGDMKLVFKTFGKLWDRSAL